MSVVGSATTTNSLVFPIATLQPDASGGANNLPPSITANGGYWSNGWWYPYYYGPWYLPPDLSVEQKVAVEVLKLGAKAPKSLRDKAFKVLAAALSS